MLGEKRSGKDTFAKILIEVAKRYNRTIQIFETGDGGVLGNFLNDFTRRLSQSKLLDKLREASRSDLITTFETLSEHFGPDIVSRGMEKKMEESSAEIVVFNAVRKPVDLVAVQSFSFWKKIYITADPKVRWERARRKAQKGEDNISFQDFLAQELRSTEAGISLLAKDAHLVVDTSDTSEEETLNIAQVFFVAQLEPILNEKITPPYL